jgi:hypothetical protein
MTNASEVLTAGLVKAATGTDEARQRETSLCEQSAAVLGMTELAIADCRRAAAEAVARTR